MGGYDISYMRQDKQKTIILSCRVFEKASFRLTKQQAYG